jgi:hypothetical protein
MGIIIGAAGLAEAAWAYELLACWVSLLFVVAAVIVAILYRSARIAVGAIILLTLFSLLVQPWNAYAPINDPLAAADPDVADWRSRFQLMAASWAFLAAATLASLPISLVMRKSTSRDERLSRPAG